MNGFQARKIYPEPLFHNLEEMPEVAGIIRTARVIGAPAFLGRALFFLLAIFYGEMPKCFLN
jgi:hypothetical protein